MCKDNYESIGKLIKILSEAVRQRANRDFKECNLTMQQTAVLSFLKERENKMETTQKDIQDYLRVAHPTAVSILKGMEQKKLIETFASETDRRMKLVRLTGREESSMKKVIEGRERMETQLLNGFTEAEEKALRNYLKRLYENIREE